MNRTPVGWRGRRVTLHTSWADAFTRRSRAAIEEVLPGFVRAQRRFGGKARRIRSATVIDAVPVPVGGGVVFVTLVRVTYIQGTADTYVLVLGFASGHEATWLRNDEPRRIVAGMTLRDGEGVLHEALGDRQSSGALTLGFRK